MAKHKKRRSKAAVVSRRSIIALLAVLVVCCALLVMISCTQNQGTTDERILRFFRMTEAIRIPEGCMLTETGESAYTRYTSCYTSDGHCCVITCEDFAPTVVSLSDFDADGSDRQSIPLSRRWSLRPPLDKESASDYN